MGVDESVLVPPVATIAGERAAKPGASPKTERRRHGARSRQASSDLRKRITKLEKDCEAAEREVASLQTALSDPAIYDRPEEVHALATSHNEAKQKAAILLAEWEAAVETLAE